MTKWSKENNTRTAFIATASGQLTNAFYYTCANIKNKNKTSNNNNTHSHKLLVVPVDGHKNRDDFNAGNKNSIYEEEPVPFTADQPVILSLQWLLSQNLSHVLLVLCFLFWV